MTKTGVRTTKIEAPLREATKGKLVEELKADLSSGCAAEAPQRGLWVADVEPATVVVEKQASAPEAVSLAEENEVQQLFQQVLSIGLRLSLQAAVLWLIVDGIRRY